MNNRIFRMVGITVPVLAMTLSGCQTDIELCVEQEHPHKCGLRYEYGWDGIERPSTMLVLAKRVIGAYNYAMEIDTETMLGRYLVNEPPLKEDNSGQPETPEQPEDIGSPEIPYEAEGGGVQVEDNDDATAGTYADFAVRSGIYKFLTVNIDDACFVYDDIENVLSAPDSNWDFNALYLKYRTYTKEDDEIKDFIGDWSDYNSYSDYVMPVRQPIVCDSIELRDINEGTVNVCRFAPHRLTQNIDIYFRIKKIIDDGDNKPFVIERVKAELSGIPERINPYNGYLDISKTCKILFDMELCDASSGNVAEDSPLRDEVLCHANIDVAAAVYGLSPDMNTGPGIMQVVVYAVSPDTGMRKKMQGKINLYNTLRAGKLVEYEVDGEYARKASDHGVIDIDQPLTISGERIISGADNNLGIDWWKEQGHIIIEM